ncbi:MAG TPA: GH25 family lysozyme [Methylovirgula sp.]|jgi:lysozyme|nr:GH25 family lysozyme [Methylovirgula sp.]
MIRRRLIALWLELLGRLLSFRRGAAPILVTLALAGCAGSEPGLIYPTASDYRIHGVDVSKYQGDIDWNTVEQSGIKFAWIKATEGGDFYDEKFSRNWELSKQAGIVRGAYHFMYWCRPAEEQAQWFIEHVPKDPSALPPVLDVEWNGSSKTCPRRVARSVALAEMKVVLAAMEQAYGKKPVIYTSIDFYHDVIEGSLTEYPLWMRSVKCNPALKYGKRRWHFWQHTEHARIPGIRGNVDENAFYGTPRQWNAFLALASDAPEPEPSGTPEAQAAPGSTSQGAPEPQGAIDMQSIPASEAQN